MKLDSIVYDYNTLQTAIATALNEESPSFQAMYPSDTATSLTNVLASYGSMLQYQIVSAMANAYTDSAYSEAGIYQLAETLGNRLHGNVSSTLYCNITRTTLKGLNNIIIPEGSKFKVGDLSFFNERSIVFPITSDTISNVKLIQGELFSTEYISSGESGEKIFFCNDFKCNMNLTRVYINDEQWQVADTFLPYVVIDESVEDKANIVIMKTDPDGRTYIKFGNNSNGKIPSKGSKIRIEYVSNEGANGNINTKNMNIELATPLYFDYEDKRVALQLDILPTTPASGGFNTQSIETLRQSSPYVFASGQRCVRRSDYKAMLLNQCGYITCNVWGEYEEAYLQGGYDKIMMNMVYYTGMKSIQKYDMQEVTTVYLDLTEINDPEYEYNFFPVDGDIIGARGFLGSYIIDIIGYDISNNPINIKYRDAYGTGILTCDPSLHQLLPLTPESDNGVELNFSTKFEHQIFPTNDLLADYTDDHSHVVIEINQRVNTQSPYSDDDPNKLITGGYTHTSGFNNNNFQMAITYDNPLQFRFTLNEKKSLTAFAFKTPDSSLSNFIGKFAIYGTNENVQVIGYDNIKNNAKWKKLTGIQSFVSNLDLNSYTDWVTTNVYVPGTAETLEENFTTRDLVGDNRTLKITELSDIDNYTYTVKISGITQPENSYSIYTRPEDPTHPDTSPIIPVIQFDTPINTIVGEIVLYGRVNDWVKYQNYVIEVYGVQDTYQRTPSYVSLKQIKALYKDSSSTVDYTDNNRLRIQLPIIENETTGYKTFGLPNAMLYYSYDLELKNVNETNGYRTGDVLFYSSVYDDITYKFKITINNIATQSFSFALNTTGSNDYSTNTILRGKSSILEEDVDFTNDIDTHTEGQNGKLSIKSTPTTKVYGTYTGNYYLDKDIQAVDLPIIEKYNHFTTYLEFKQPRIKNVNIELDVEYENVSTYLTTKANIVKAINALFEVKPDSIGNTLNLSDIWKAVNSVDGITRFNVLLPTTNITSMPYELILLPEENLVINDIINSEYK